MKPKRKWVWVTRSRCLSAYVVIYYGKQQPENIGDGFLQPGGSKGAAFCYKEFVRVTGLKVRVNECRKVAFTAEVCRGNVE